MKKIALNDWIDDDFILIAICSHEDDFHICWVLNKLMEFDFIRLEDVELRNNKQDKVLQFSVFRYIDSEFEIEYTLISNKSSDGILMKQHNKVDYFIKILGEYHLLNLDDFLNSIKSIQSIQTAYMIEVNTLKTKEYLQI